MPIQSQKYIRKPLYVEAVRVSPHNFEDISRWCQGAIEQDEVPGEGTKRYIKVRVHNPKNPRQTKAFVGDWLLYTERGYKVYTNKAFHGSFDLVPEEETLNQAVETLRASEEPKEAVLVTPAQAAELKVEKGVVPQPGKSVGAVPQEDYDVAAEVNRQMREGLQTRVGESVAGIRNLDVAKPEPRPVPPPSTVPPPKQTVEDVATPPEDKIEPVAAEGRRVLSIAEQTRMTPEEVRALIQSGEVVLAQDIAQP